VRYVIISRCNSRRTYGSRHRADSSERAECTDQRRRFKHSIFRSVGIFRAELCQGLRSSRHVHHHTIPPPAKRPIAKIDLVSHDTLDASCYVRLDEDPFVVTRNVGDRFGNGAASTVTIPNRFAVGRSIGRGTPRRGWTRLSRGSSGFPTSRARRERTDSRWRAEDKRRRANVCRTGAIAAVASDQLLGKTKHSRAALRHRVRRRRALSLSVALAFARFSIRATPSFIGDGHDPRVRLSLGVSWRIRAIYPGTMPSSCRLERVRPLSRKRGRRESNGSATQHKQCCAVRTVSLCAERSHRTKRFRFPRCFSTTTSLVRIPRRRIADYFASERFDDEGSLGQRPRNASVGDLAWI